MMGSLVTDQIFARLPTPLFGVENPIRFSS